MKNKDDLFTNAKFSKSRTSLESLLVLDAHVQEEGLDLGVVGGAVLHRERGQGGHGGIRVFVVVLLEFLDELRAEADKSAERFRVSFLKKILFGRRPEIDSRRDSCGVVLVGWDGV